MGDQAIGAGSVVLGDQAPVDKWFWAIVATTPEGDCGGVNLILDESMAKRVFDTLMKRGDSLLEPGAKVDLYRCRLIEREDQLPPSLRSAENQN
jgi:hypothetical protein